MIILRLTPLMRSGHLGCSSKADDAAKPYVARAGACARKDRHRPTCPLSSWTGPTARRQMVCHGHGKSAQTDWRLLEITEERHRPRPEIQPQDRAEPPAAGAYAYAIGQSDSWNIRDPFLGTGSQRVGYPPTYKMHPSEELAVQTTLRAGIRPRSAPKDAVLKAQVARTKRPPRRKVALVLCGGAEGTKIFSAPTRDGFDLR